MVRDPLFEESRVVSYTDPEHDIDRDYRSSWSAYLDEGVYPPTTEGEAVIHCIEERAVVFQGYKPLENLEALQVVRYFLPNDPIDAQIY
jgi:hypothetical protein